jgi:hypothetical protein
VSIVKQRRFANCMAKQVFTVEVKHWALKFYTSASKIQQKGVHRRVIGHFRTLAHLMNIIFSFLQIPNIFHLFSCHCLHSHGPKIFSQVAPCLFKADDSLQDLRLREVSIRLGSLFNRNLFTKDTARASFSILNELFQCWGCVHGWYQSSGKALSRTLLQRVSQECLASFFGVGAPNRN